MEKSGNYPVNGYCSEGDDWNWNSCNCLHLDLGSSVLQSFPNKQGEEIGQGHCHCKQVPVINIFHIRCLWDSIKAALKECVKAELWCQNQHNCCCEMNLFIKKQGCNSYDHGGERRQVCINDHECWVSFHNKFGLYSWSVFIYMKLRFLYAELIQCLFTWKLRKSNVGVLHKLKKSIIIITYLYIPLCLEWELYNFLVLLGSS